MCFLAVLNGVEATTGFSIDSACFINSRKDSFGAAVPLSAAGDVLRELFRYGLFLNLDLVATDTGGDAELLWPALLASGDAEASFMERDLAAESGCDFVRDLLFELLAPALRSWSFSLSFRLASFKRRTAGSSSSKYVFGCVFPSWSVRCAATAGDAFEPAGLFACEEDAFDWFDRPESLAFSSSFLSFVICDKSEAKLMFTDVS